MQRFKKPEYGFTILTLLVSVFFTYPDLIHAETSANNDGNAKNQELIMTSQSIQLPASLLEEIHTLCTNEKFDETLALAIAERMFALNEVLRPLNEEEAKRTPKDRQYILSNSFTSFMYIMLAISDYSLANKVDSIYFPPPIKKLIRLLIEHQLVTDHSSFDQMLSTLERIDIKQEGYQSRITLFTPTGKTVEESFKEGIPSPRFVISSVIFSNGASFLISDLLAPENQHEYAEFRKDSQKGFITGGLILMDSKKENILGFLDEQETKDDLHEQLIRPLLIQGQGFAGRGYVRGLKLPSPSAKMETIYLIPGRDGTPAFVRAHSLFLKPFVAL